MVEKVDFLQERFGLRCQKALNERMLYNLENLQKQEREKQLKDARRFIENAQDKSKYGNPFVS